MPTGLDAVIHASFALFTLPGYRLHDDKDLSHSQAECGMPAAWHIYSTRTSRRSLSASLFATSDGSPSITSVFFVFCGI